MNSIGFPKGRSILAVASVMQRGVSLWLRRSRNICDYRVAWGRCFHLSIISCAMVVPCYALLPWITRAPFVVFPFLVLFGTGVVESEVPDVYEIRCSALVSRYVHKVGGIRHNVRYFVRSLCSCHCEQQLDA
eukprot:IDg10109t1